jgi:hypothetical protein
MKTLVELGVEPCVGMIVQSPTHGRLLHHIIEIETGRYGVWVKSINERGTSARNFFTHVKNNWFFVGYSKTPYKSLFDSSDIGYNKINEAKKLIKQIEELWK